ncbi:MAG: transglutaminase-like domain-containing protein [Myxococcota bacterium]
MRNRFSHSLIIASVAGGLLGGFGLVGCGGEGPTPWPGSAPPNSGPPPNMPVQTPPGEAAPTSPEDEAVPVEIPTAGHESKRFKVTLTAEFTELPEGARILAPSPRDRRYQKVSKSEHSGAPGAVMPAEDHENLFFVSDALTAPTASYSGTFEVTRRQGSQGALQAAEGQDYDGSEPPLGEVSTDAGIVAAATALGAEKKKPYDEVLAVLAAAGGIALADDGPADAAKALADKRASELGLARATVEMLRLRGVVAQVVQGIDLGAGSGTVSTSRVWLDANMPQLGWVPLDPAKRRSMEDWPGEVRYVGLLPVDRIDLAYGDSTVLAEDGSFPRTTLTGDLATPMAIKDGARVGKVTWSAKIEVLPDAE